ncbi:hypothetical protein PENTCL1PPCAC_12598 [Pristionchus entomophagus]|uniref:Uncharacterized protein n=1 Tax=Pristionchus entomophagus TaxID=358040 RepID=A0AAV5T577_9BILA|nr:hypothetical protein PENTCL1PPCAC_12598 [Pristionchus entomophagus]
MRHLALLCLAAAAAVSGYNLVLQEVQLSGGLITSDDATITCDNIQYLHIGDKNDIKFYCYNVTSVTDDSLESVTLEYQSGPITSKAKNLKVMVILTDGSNVAFTFTPNMKVGELQNFKPTDCKYYPLVVPTTVKPSVALAVPAAAAAVPFADVDSEQPAAIRIRGPGPVRPILNRDSPEDTVVAEDDEERRVRREAATEDPPKVDSNTVNVVVNYFVLDEAGNPAAVWAAVIEGIILLVLVGLCFWFFFWSPRARTAAATTAADPYKDGPSYSVSYANSSYNNQNQRIDAFQNPTPAAPPRPANSAYMDDYVTDNIGAMARPAAAAAPTPAASAANPATSSSAFQPGHQRFDSSGLVTVNLS